MDGVLMPSIEALLIGAERQPERVTASKAKVLFTSIVPDNDSDESSHMAS